MIKGVDVSGYQSASGFSLSGLDFVFVKVTEGLSYVNSKWSAQRDYAKAHGLVVGFYHYPHMGNSPVAEADYFLKQVSWKPGDIIVLDWEGYDAANSGVSNATKRAYRDKWLSYVKGKLPGHRVGIYANTDYWLNVDQTSNCGDFLWIATAGKAAGDPGIDYAWKFHQYSTANGIDHDVAAFDSRAALAAWAGLQEEAVALTDADVKKIVQTDGFVKSPDYKLATETNKFWTVESYLYEGYHRAVEGRDASVAAVAAIKALSAKVDKLSAGGVDLDALAKKVADLLAARLAS